MTSDRLREDLQYVEENWDEVNDPEGRVAVAARRFLALTETGPDYDKADDKATELGYVDIVWDDLIAIVDAALRRDE